MASKLVFIGGALKAPPATWDAFQMLPQVGLIFQNMKDEGFQKINNLTLIDACFFHIFVKNFSV